MWPRVVKQITRCIGDFVGRSNGEYQHIWKYRVFGIIEKLVKFFCIYKVNVNIENLGFEKRRFFSTDVKHLGAFLLTVGSDLLKATTETGEICLQGFACEELIFART